MPLYGHELSDCITPLEAGLGFFVKLDKDDFIGKSALQAQADAGVSRIRCGLELTVRGIAREGAPVFVGDGQIGAVSSGTHAPQLNRSLAMALLKVEYSQIDTPVEIEVRGKRLAAKVVALPFYKRVN